MTAKLSRHARHSGSSASLTRHSASGRAAAGVAAAQPASQIPPLHWWRRLQASAFTHAHLTVVQGAIAGFGIIGEPLWQAAEEGDPAAAIVVVLHALQRYDQPHPTFDLVASALLRCALEGSETAGLALAHVLDRIVEDDPSCVAIAASWRSFVRARQSRRELKDA